jgi:hypothetical protein
MPVPIGPSMAGRPALDEAVGYNYHHILFQYAVGKKIYLHRKLSRFI